MENNEQFNWCGYTWKTTAHIKNDNDNYKNAYFSPNAVYLQGDELHLGIIRSRTKWEDQWTMSKDYIDKFKVADEPIKITKPIINSNNPWPIREFGVGEVVSEDVFSYGVFTWKARLPKGAHLWPALWLTGHDAWPPEIDTMEGYSDETGSYKRGSMMRLETNVHYLEDGIHKQTRPKGISNLLYKILHRSDWDEWKVDYTPNHIYIYFNGVRIRCIKDKEIIDYFKRYPHMNVIMNMMILAPFDLDNYVSTGHNAELVVKSFKYRSL